MELPVKSATYAMKGRQLLHLHGIRAYVGKRSGEDGCYYYLNVADKNLAVARQLLMNEEILK